MPINSNIQSQFVTTRYFGSKKKILPVLEEIFLTLKFKSACDVFGGTGAVSHLLMSMGKEVHYNDAFKFNAAIAMVLLSSENQLPQKQEVFDILENVKLKKGFISKKFQNIFYKDAENKWLDGFCSKLVSDHSMAMDIAFYGVSQAALMKRPFNLFHRANLNLRLNNVSRKFGNSTTWDRTFIDLAKRCIEEVYLLQRFDVPLKVEFGDVSLVNVDSDLLYIDPPYLKETSIDCYLKKYHFLEGMYRYDEWPKLICHKLKSKSLKNHSFITEMSKLAGFKDRMHNLISTFNGKHVVISYVNNNQESYDYMISLLSDNGYDINLVETESRHVLAKEKLSEVTIIGSRA